MRWAWATVLGTRGQTHPRRRALSRTPPSYSALKRPFQCGFWCSGISSRFPRVPNDSPTLLPRSKDVKKVLRFYLSRAELAFYLCDKYKLSSEIRNQMETNWNNGLLRLAFHTRDARLADEVRKKIKTFTWKEWLLYYGAKNVALHYPFQLAALFRNSFKKEHNRWK